MAPLADYTAGTISVSANGTVVTGVGTAWKTAAFKAGDWFIASGWINVVASVGSDTQLTLAQPWRGGTLTGAAYILRRTSENAAVAEQGRKLITMLGDSGTLEAFGELVGAANTMPFFTGPGTAATTPLTAFARTLLGRADAAAAYGTLGQIPNAQLPPRIRATNTSHGITDCNNLNETGWYFMPAGTTNLPPGKTGNIYVENINQNAGLGNKQIAYDNATHRSWTRYVWYGTGAWSPWVETTADPGSSLVTNGYQRLPSGLILQWGISTGVASYNVTFPVAFPTAPLVITTSINPGASAMTDSLFFGAVAASPTTAGFTVQKRLVSSSGVSPLTSGYNVYWFAVGV